VLDLTTKKPLAGAQVQLQIGTDKNHEVVATTTTDTTGSFVFENVKPEQYSLSCFYKMSYDKTNLPNEVLDNLGRSDIDSNVNVVSGQSYHRDFYLQVACPYDKTKDQDYCPVCKKKDMVQEIFWGLPVYDSNGKCVVKGKDISEYYLGGCSPDLWCNPTKHCKRCNIDF
jgi:hypothetical protein